MALIIYLDTQDYINLFNETIDGPNHQVLKKLLEYRERGKIVIGFSFFTIVEFITKPDAANREERVKRGQLIKDICGPNAFPYLSAIQEEATFPNDGMWMFSAGDLPVSAQKCRRMLRSEYLKQLKEMPGLNRRRRRQLGRQKSMKNLFLSCGSDWGKKRSDWGDIPVSDEFVQSGIMHRFMTEQCTDSEFEKRINAWVMDPAEFSRIFYDYADQPNLIEKYYAEPIGRLKEAIETLQNAVYTLQQVNVEILRERASLIEAGWNKSEARRLTKQAKIPKPDREVFGDRLEAILGQDRAEHFLHFMAHSVKPRYKFKRSDAMDLMHLCYAYDCDLVRCDKAMAIMFQDFAPFQGKLVGRFGELPGRIFGVLAERRC